MEESKTFIQSTRVTDSKEEKPLKLADNFHPLADPIFKRWMNDKYICAEFLNALLKEEIEIQEIHPQYEIGGGHVKARGIRLDILAKDQKFEIYNLEAQTKHEQDHTDRTVFHGCRLISSQLKQGQRFDTIKKTTVIFINTENRIGESLVDSVSLRHDKKPYNIYNHKFRIININLDKVGNFILKEENHDESKLRFFITFLLFGYNEKAFEQMYKECELNFPHLKEELKKQFNFMRNDAQFCNEVDKFWKENGIIKEAIPMLLVNRLLEEGELKGKLEGKLEGEIKGKLQVAFKFIDRGMSLDEVSETVELDLHTLEELYSDRDKMTLDEIVQRYMYKQSITF